MQLKCIQQQIIGIHKESNFGRPWHISSKMEESGLYVIEQTHIDDIVIWQSEAGEIYQTVGGLKPEKIADGIIDYFQ